jgi:hypothetical protein
MTKKPVQRPEQTLQKQVIQFLWAAKTPEWSFYAVPNGGYRTKAEAAIFQACGVRAGVPDIAIVHKGAARFIELKAPDGRVTSLQHLMMSELEIAGAVTTVCRSLDEVIQKLNAWGINLKARAA